MAPVGYGAENDLLSARIDMAEGISELRDVSSEYVEAEMRYVVDDGIPPISYIDWPEEEHKAHPPTYEHRRVRIENGRPRRDEFDLPTHGFKFINHQTAVKDFYSDAEVENVFYPEVAEHIRQAIGAESVHVFDHTIRTPKEVDRDTKYVRKPVKSAHNDYTDNSARQRVRDLLPPEEAEQRLKRRFAIVQLWTSIAGPIESEPLAICDGKSIPEEGFILIERRYSYRTGEVFHIAYNPAHKWIYFPHMDANEALIFKVFDSDADAGVRFTGHSAFDDPTTPENAKPRESIEMRAFAFF